VPFQKISIFSHRRNWNFYWMEGQGFCKVKNLKKCMKLGISREVKIKKNCLPWKRYGYLLELHSLSK